MEDRDPVPEPRPEARHRLRRQADLGDEHDRAAAAGQHRRMGLSLFDLAAIFLTLSAGIGWLNLRIVRLPTAVAMLMRTSLVLINEILISRSAKAPNMRVATPVWVRMPTPVTVIAPAPQIPIDCNVRFCSA